MPPPVTPTKRRSPAKPPRNKVETSPNNRSKCQKCGAKITKGEQRFGIVESSEYGRTQRYYHPKCCPQSLRSKLPSPEKVAQDKQVDERIDLYDDLKQLRSLFAAALDVEHFKIFHDKSLEELVLNMPTTESELLTIWGIKEKKVACFGEPILAVIRQYQRKYDAIPTATPSKKKAKAKPKPKKPRSKSQAKQKESTEDEPIIMGEILTCDELVRRKFQVAKANGYVISVD